jgi:hypothetical protein
MNCTHGLSTTLLLLAACSACSGGATDGTLFGDDGGGGGATSAPGTTLPGDGAPGQTGGADASVPTVDSGTRARDAATPSPPSPPSPPPPSPPGPTPDAGSGGDGTPTRSPCTGTLGSGLSTQHARLDGVVVAVIPPGQGRQCNGDASHVHIQVLMNGAVYDVAANVDGLMTQKDAPLVAGAWSEGWHTQAALDYPKDLGAHAADFTLTGTAAVAQAVETALAKANHVSIFCTGYGTNGCHLVHRQRTGKDGGIVLDPLSASPRWLLFDFSTDSF